MWKIIRSTLCVFGMLVISSHAHARGAAETSPHLRRICPLYIATEHSYRGDAARVGIRLAFRAHALWRHAVESRAQE
jgi:hypothetical protein